MVPHIPFSHDPTLHINVNHVNESYFRFDDKKWNAIILYTLDPIWLTSISYVKCFKEALHEDDGDMA